MTQLEHARQGEYTPEMEVVAADENIARETLINEISAGRVVIPANKNHKSLHPVGIGRGLKTKINANIGTSADFPSMEAELKKLELVVRYKADAVMDLSTGGDISAIRRTLLAHSPLPFGNVPIYQIVVEGARRGQSFVSLTIADMLQYIREQAADGVDFMTIHAGLTRAAVETLRQHPRRAGIVSRGGSFLTAWMVHNDRENPFLEHFDDILTIAREYDVTLSLGDGLRPGALADGSDRAQISELVTLGGLVQRSRAAGVQVMVEGPGHLPIQQVEMNIRLQKTLCDEAPFYVLGPLLTDIAPGYDHLTSAMGGAIAGSAGADFLCYVTPAEHLGLPDEEDVKQGIITARIAAHVADIGKGLPGALEWDARMADARRRLDWQAQEAQAIDPETFARKRSARRSQSDACSMCGDMCVYKILNDLYQR